MVVVADFGPWDTSVGVPHWLYNLWRKGDFFIIFWLQLLMKFYAYVIMGRNVNAATVIGCRLPIVLRVRYNICIGCCGSAGGSTSSSTL